MLREALKAMLDVQELDIQMIRLMRLKRERLTELSRIRALRDDLHHQVVLKESEIIELKKQMRLIESEVSEFSSKVQKLEAQQSSVRKVEEFNALTHEISALEREKAAKEQRLSDSYDKLGTEEEFLKNLKSSFEATKSNSDQMEQEIKASVDAINSEGKEIMGRRSVMAEKADKDIMAVYEKLLQNKKDRVIVPIENRCCSGCHIMVTAQHENVVRKGERLVFCEHCSRIHYWHEHLIEGESASAGASARRRRRVPAKAS
jgi:predicted  nucleic acid-binding Zn-ribbon protein